MAKKKLSLLEDQYEAIKREAKNGYYSSRMAALIGEIYQASLTQLNSYSRQDLISKVSDKDYFAFTDGKKYSRPINKALFVPGLDKWEALHKLMQADSLEGNITAAELTRTLYSVAISFCAGIDMLKDRDQQTPGTFFQYFIAFFFTWRVGVEPRNWIQILNVDNEDTKLTTDFVFNLGPKKQKFHMPIKTSSRERAIMLWAHQRMIDGVYGMERFMGTPVLLAETKTDSKKKEVIEICLPEQWRLYQLYIAKLKRIYYLDLPNAYAKLGDEFPPLAVKPFGEFFFEWDKLTPT